MTGDEIRSAALDYALRTEELLGIDSMSARDQHRRVYLFAEQYEQFMRTGDRPEILKVSA